MNSSKLSEKQAATCVGMLHAVTEIGMESQDAGAVFAVCLRGVAPNTEAALDMLKHIGEIFDRSESSSGERVECETVAESA